MAIVQIVYKNGRKAPSFETFDPKVIARYRGYGITDPAIEHVTVDGVPADTTPDQTSEEP